MCRPIPWSNEYYNPGGLIASGYQQVQQIPCSNTASYVSMTKNNYPSFMNAYPTDYGFTTTASNGTTTTNAETNNVMSNEYTMPMTMNNSITNDAVVYPFTSLPEGQTSFPCVYPTLTLADYSVNNGNENQYILPSSSAMTSMPMENVEINMNLPMKYEREMMMIAEPSQAQINNELNNMNLEFIPLVQEQVQQEDKNLENEMNKDILEENAKEEDDDDVTKAITEAIIKEENNYCADDLDDVDMNILQVFLVESSNKLNLPIDQSVENNATGNGYVSDEVYKDKNYVVQPTISPVAGKTDDMLRIEDVPSMEQPILPSEPITIASSFADFHAAVLQSSPSSEMTFKEEPNMSFQSFLTKNPAPLVTEKSSTTKHKNRALCKFQGCSKRSRSQGLCIAHGGGKRCIIEGCHKSSQGGNLCIRHGGGKRCIVKGCFKAAQSSMLCKAHGGGPRCQFPGCDRSSQGGGFCRTHGGGKRCAFTGCKKGTQRGEFCALHGGSKLCSVENCTRNDRGGGFCATHGGGRRCAAPGCLRPCRRKGKCSAHLRAIPATTNTISIGESIIAC